MPETTDVVVVGGGLGGMSAALAAAEGGLRVRLFESGPALGGAALLSAGSLWTFPSVDEYLAHCPGADPSLVARVVSSYDDVVAWLQSTGVKVTNRGPSLYGPKVSRLVDPEQLVRRLTEELAERVDVHLNAQVTGIDPQDDGVHVNAQNTVIETTAVILATGGVHTDPAVLHAASLDHYIGLAVRNRPVSGDGVRLALSRGAALAGTTDGIYGHLVPAGLPPELTTATLAAQYQSVAGVLVSLNGATLAGPGTRDHDLNRLVARTPGRRAVLLYDASASPFGRQDAGITHWAADRTAFITAHSGRVLSASSVEGLARMLAEWGVSLQPEALAVANLSLRVAPLTAVMVQPSITHAGAGIEVDASLRAVGLDRVYVAGADIGRAFGDGYGGGISFALTTGLAAGREAASAIAPSVSA